MTKVNNEWKKQWNYLLNKKKNWKNPDEVNKILTEFVEKILQEHNSDYNELLTKLKAIITRNWDPTFDTYDYDEIAVDIIKLVTNSKKYEISKYESRRKEVKN